jgi:hypothetical protein
MSRRSFAAAFLGIALLGGLAAAIGLSSSTNQQPSPTSSSKVVRVAYTPPSYPVNAQGQTFGSIARTSNPSDYPDLIEVVATNGVIGYINKAAFLGTPPTLQQVLSYPRDSSGNFVAPSSTVPVYSSDGTTQVGIFNIGGNGPSTNFNSGTTPESKP